MELFTLEDFKIFDIPGSVRIWRRNFIKGAVT